MMYFLTDAVTRRFILELRRFWGTHPKYRDMVDSIQGKYVFRQRPQRGIIVKAGGATHTPLSADHYRGVIHSYTHLTKANGKPGLSVEWVREDMVAIQNNGGAFPSPPGIYYLDVREEDGGAVFYVDPLLDVVGERVESRLAQLPLKNTLRLFEMPSEFLLSEGIHYTLEGQQIALQKPLSPGQWLQADYRYPAPSTGPHTLVEMHANNSAIPGVVLSFGRRVEAGDQLAVVVEPVRRPASLAYGGRWELSLEFEVMARDVYDQREITDMTAMYLQSAARERLSFEGLEITNVSIGGESEEVYDETGDDYFYNGSISLTMESDWVAYVPLDVSFRHVAPLTKEQATFISSLSDEDLEGQENNIRLWDKMGLKGLRDPFWQTGYGYPIIR